MDPDNRPDIYDVYGWPMLPSHPKIAILYLQGRIIHMAGFHLGIEILTMFPAQFVAERELWEGQLRAGVTPTAAGADMSVHNRAWTRIDPFFVDRLVLRPVGVGWARRGPVERRCAGCCSGRAAVAAASSSRPLAP
jgi:hypothetical protein